MKKRTTAYGRAFAADALKGFGPAYISREPTFVTLSCGNINLLVGMKPLKYTMSYTNEKYSK